jgi:hypothetical protein
MFFTLPSFARVMKTTGGKLWNKRWGVPSLSPTRKANRKESQGIIQKNLSVIKAAAAAEPAVHLKLPRAGEQAQLWRRYHHQQQKLTQQK